MTGNPKELRRARKAANEAAAMLEAIEALPRRRGSSVRWRNGVIWTRIGDDQWQPLGTDGETIGPLYPSAHVASAAFWPVTAHTNGRSER